MGGFVNYATCNDIGMKSKANATHVQEEFPFCVLVTKYRPN